MKISRSSRATVEFFSQWWPHALSWPNLRPSWGITAFFLSTLPHALSCFPAVLRSDWVIPVTSQIWVVKTVLVAAGLVVGFVQGFRWSPITVNTCEDMNLTFKYCFTNDLYMLCYEDRLSRYALQLLSSWITINVAHVIHIMFMLVPRSCWLYPCLCVVPMHVLCLAISC